MIGFGTTANCFEGTGPAPAPSATLADIRTNLLVDNINNATDFTAGAPNPHSSGGSAPPPPPVPSLAIHTIQGIKLPTATTATVSAYAGQQVSTTGVVTAVLSNGFFIQARDSDKDSDLTTPEGIEVFTSSAPPADRCDWWLRPGGRHGFNLSGRLTASHTPATELTSPTVTLITPAVALPAPITLTAAMLTASGGLYQPDAV